MESNVMKLIRDEAERLAASCVEGGFLCSESVLMALTASLGISSDLIPRIATGFGAGVGRRGEVCGALSGAVMGLGLKFGRNNPVDRKDGRRPYWFASEFVDIFRNSFGEVRCEKLLGLDLSNREDLQKYRESRLWEKVQEFHNNCNRARL